LKNNLQIPSDFKGYFEFQETDLSSFLEQNPFKTILVVSGNRGGKTGSIAKHYVDRVFGLCKTQPWKNKLARKIRCMSSTLPNDVGEDEDDNAQYIELKKRIPSTWIEKDITARSSNLVVRRPTGMNTTKTIFEFRSSKQDTQDLGKIDLSSVWHDEETPKIKREECRMRLMEEDGDELFSLTAINPISYVHPDVFQRAEFIGRTETIANKFNLPLEEWPKENRGSGIGVFQMATDDNPILDATTIDRIFQDITDPDDLALRRYGVFKQITGRVVKSYDPRVCYLSMNKYFPSGVPYEWFHSRGIDYHESRLPWSIGWMSVSPNDEAFVWREFHPAIDGHNAYTTYDIAKSILRKSGDYYYSVNLIDPLANKVQPNTGTSATQDLNRYFDQIRELSGLGTGAFWEGWDTKGTTGRDEVHKRFKNAVRCGKPFNNTVRENGEIVRLPTMWVMDSCPNFHKSLINWSYGEYIAANTKAVNDPKEKPNPKWSHDNMVLEGLLKDRRVLNAAFLIHNPPRQHFQKIRSVTGR